MHATLRCCVVAAATLLVSLVGVDAQSCVHEFDGFYYDLRSMKGTVYSVPTTDYTYAFSLCENIPASNTNWGKCSGNACQFNAAGRVVGTISRWEKASPPVWSLVAPAPAAPGASANGDPTVALKSLQLTLDNGSNCSAPTAPRVGKFKFVCQANSESPTVYQTPDADGGTCSVKGGYVFTIKGKVGCPHKGKFSGGGSDGLSGGWVFIIILLVGSFVYCVAGCVWMNRREGATGTDMIPQKAFWAALPGYVLDGCRATWGFALGLCNKGGGGAAAGASSYDEIE